MRVLDLFSGLGGWSAAFRDRGHEVITIDNDYRFNPTYVRDIGSLESLAQFGSFDIILASPPCENFSIASAYLHWKGGQPNRKAQYSIALIRRTLALIEMAQPKFWVMENPRGMLRKIMGKPSCTIWQCQYGREFAKPTDLWGILPPSFEPKVCRSRATCSHIKTAKKLNGWTKNGINGLHARQYASTFGMNHYRFQRGAMDAAYQRAWVKGDSGMGDYVRDASLRALLPFDFSQAVCLAAEKDLIA